MHATIIHTFTPFIWSSGQFDLYTQTCIETFPQTNAHIQTKTDMLSLSMGMEQQASRTVSQRSDSITMPPKEGWTP